MFVEESVIAFGEFYVDKRFARLSSRMLGAPILHWTMVNISFASGMIWPHLILLERYL